MTDTLTGLSNTRYFRQVAHAALATSADLSLFLLDLDRFKTVNDTLGHPIGDHLLRKVADRLRAALRPSDVLARLGGDEFAILLQPAGEHSDRERIATRIIELLSRPYLIDGEQVNVGSSVGIAVAEPGSTYEQMIKRADLALYAAKETGGGTHVHFEKTLADRADARRSMELELRKALTLRQFEVHYRPRFDVDSGKLVGLHAVLRWNHPQRGMLDAPDFVPLAAQIGLLPKIERWLLEAACREAATLPDLLPLSVSVVQAHFGNKSQLLESVGHALFASQLQPSLLEIEVTELMMLTQKESTIDSLYALRALGVRVVMNDFGLGYASLTNLTSFPFDAIKIAPSIADCSSATNQAIVQAVAALGASLGVTTTLDGISSRDYLAQLRQRSNSSLQGCHVQDPIAPAQLQELVQHAGLIQLS